MVTIAILGMHRSGTSCLTRMLQHAGVYLGDDLMDGVASSNLEGHGESLEAVRINDRILQLSGGAWDRVPAELRGDGETTARIRAFLQSLEGHPAAAWKDPRTTLTFPLWKQHLAAYRLAACFRHPLAVARSLAVRDGWPLEKGLDLWAAYNERLLQHVASEGDLFWFDFDLPEGELRASVGAHCRGLGLAAPAAAAAAFNPFLRHHTEVEPVAVPRIAEIYEELRRRARASRAGASPAAGAEPAPKDRLAQLAQVQRRQNEVQQRQARSQEEIRHQQVHLENELRRHDGQWQTAWKHWQGLREAQQQLQTHFAEEIRQQNQLMLEKMQAQHQDWAASLTDLRGLLERLTAEVDHLRAAQQEHGDRLVECQRFVARVRDHAVFRMRRAVRQGLRVWAALLRNWLGRSGGRPRPRKSPSPPASGALSRAA